MRQPINRIKSHQHIVNTKHQRRDFSEIYCDRLKTILQWTAKLRTLQNGTDLKINVFTGDRASYYTSKTTEEFLKRNNITAHHAISSSQWMNGLSENTFNI